MEKKYTKALILFLFLMGQAYAQVNDRVRMKSEVFSKKDVIQSQMEQSVWRVGSWYLSPILSLGKIGYDSNLYSQGEGEKNGDFVVSPQLGMKSYFRISPRYVVNLEASSGYSWYKDNSSLRGWSPKFQARFIGIFKRYFMEVGSTFTRDYSRGNTETLDRSENERTAMFLNTMLQITSRSYLRLSVRSSETEYTSAEDQVNQDDRSEDSITASYVFKRSSGFWPFVEYTSKTTELLRFNAPSTVDDQTIRIGARNGQDGRFHFLSKVGVHKQQYTVLSGNNETSEDAEELEYQIFTGYDITRQFNIEVGFNQTVVYSFFSEYSHYLSQRTLLGFGWTFKNGIKLGPDFYMGTNDYKAREDSVALDEQYKYFSSNMSVSFPLAQKTNMQVSLGYEDRELPFHTESVTSWYSFMKINYKF